MSLVTFSNGTVANATDVNSNFTGLANASEIAAGSITAAKISAEAWGTWTASPVGWSSPTTTSVYLQLGKVVIAYINITGTSNATSLTFTLPVAAKRTYSQMGLWAADNGTGTRPRLEFTAASTAANVSFAETGGAWTASGTKQLQGVFMYEAN